MFKLKNYLFIFISVFVSSCLMPQDFVAEIKVTDSEQIIVDYQGEVLHLMANSAYKEWDGINPLDDQRLDGLKHEMREKKNFKSVRYAGKGVFKVKSLETLNLNQASEVFQHLETYKQKDGAIVLGIKDLNGKQLEFLHKSGVEIKGTVRILLPKTARVLHHNAELTPGFFNSYYVWKIKSYKDSPNIKFHIF